MKRCRKSVITCILVIWSVVTVHAAGQTIPADPKVLKASGSVKPKASHSSLKVGDEAPDFTLRDTSGNPVSLSSYRNKKNVVLSFVSAAWTPVCSQQWPGYNIAKEVFEERNTVLLGISVDNVPSLHAWITNMGGVWFPVLSDFWPHGAVANKYGVLRDDGISERALFLIDTHGVIRYIDVHEINRMPRLENLVKELQKLTP